MWGGGQSKAIEVSHQICCLLGVGVGVGAGAGLTPTRNEENTVTSPHLQTTSVSNQSYSRL